MNSKLESNRILLRKYKLSDIDDYFEYISKPEVGGRIGFPPYKTKEEALERLKIELGKPYHFAIVLKEENKVVGSIQLHEPKPNRYESIDSGDTPYEIGFMLSPSYWGRGLMPEATVLMNDFAFDVLNATTVLIGHVDKNIQSGKVQEKIGFKIEGEVPNYREWTDGTMVSLITRSMTPEEWSAIREEKFKLYVK